MQNYKPNYNYTLWFKGEIYLHFICKSSADRTKNILDNLNTDINCEIKPYVIPEFEEYNF